MTKIIITDYGEKMSVEIEKRDKEGISFLNTLLSAYVKTAQTVLEDHDIDCDCDTVPFHMEVLDAIKKILTDMRNIVNNREQAIKNMFGGENE